MNIDVRDMVSVSEANSRGVSKLVSEAEAGKEWIILRGSKPAAAVIGMQRLQRMRELEELEEDIDYLITATVRVLAGDGQSVTADALMVELEIDPTELVETIS